LSSDFKNFVDQILEITPRAGKYHYKISGKHKCFKGFDELFEARGGGENDHGINGGYRF